MVLIETTIIAIQVHKCETLRPLNGETCVNSTVSFLFYFYLIYVFVVSMGIWCADIGWIRAQIATGSRSKTRSPTGSSKFPSKSGVWG